ncbi:4-hydroxyacetophenone monooxygenase [Mycobacterium paraffinicum]|uniref:4-hydroxyacetophenone monooxygenase n=1 Tax=Mycobacterium paraffinicum TaxID=53378 RepID=A0A1Q4HKI7_9MYCO|nr:NAD(P)/FAD-dependent oxidoreductase [Mycobacterium paraffinicum]OJZ67911.1 4-hydroxyacetophenone monooxygenase [Mycobacterium paraffinicum]
MTNALNRNGARVVRVAIIGSGFAGLGAAIRLRQAGIDDIVVLERAGAVGGVWRDNAYPGAACDVESYLYSFSFAPNARWQHMFSPQPEIFGYLQRVADDFGLTPHIRLNCPVEEARWDASAARWRLTTRQGAIEAEHMVVATGALADPAMPRLPGIDHFAGKVFHSSRWDHSFDLRGKRVAAIGTGASAIQFVPAIQPHVAQLTLFQRSAPWVMPRHDRAIGPTEQRLLEKVPGLHWLYRARIYARRELNVLAFRHPALMKSAERTSLKHLRAQVSDPDLRAKLTPTYRLGCKRVLISNDYWRSLDQPNADVVTSGIREVTRSGIVDNDGTLHEVDAIIFGTGFKTDHLPLTDRIYGADGASMAQSWGRSPRAHLGTMVAGYPNVYLMHGPNIGLAHTSVIHMLESQIEVVIDAIRYAAHRGAATIEPTVQAQARFVEAVDQLTEGSVWTAGGCDNWYRDATGRNSHLWPSATFDFRRRTRQFRPEDYVVHPARPRADLLS